MAVDKYSITINALGRYPLLSISKSEFDDIRLSKAVLAAALSIEEKYELICCNYLEFEQDLLSNSLSRVVKLDMDYGVLFDERLRFNRRIINILTSARMYVDQMKGNLRDCLPGDDHDQVDSFFEALKHEQYDSNFDYAFVEALRNHAQHAGMCVSQVKLDSRNYAHKDGGRLWENRTIVLSSKKFLSENPKFKRSVLNKMPDQVDLSVAIRVYVGCISAIHEAIREKIKASVDSARKNLEAVITRYNELCEPTTNVVHANRYDGDSLRPVDTVPVFLEWDDVRVSLEQRNFLNSNLVRHYVSSRPDSVVSVNED